MKNFMILTESIHYIEDNLQEAMSRDDIAKHSCVSLSMLEKLSHYALGMSIKRYITKRRMTQAAKDIVAGCYTITDLAMQYQYNSVEVFSRAFKDVWSVNPSEFKSNWTFTGIFPKINYEFKEGDDLYMARKRVDMSEAYKYLKDKKDSYVLCFDIQNLTGFNNLSQKAGDLAILEQAARIDREATEDMLTMRIGGDEFALVTGCYQEEEARRIADAILSKNGLPIIFEGTEYLLSLWCGITKIPESLRYSDFFTDMHKAINNSKK